MPEYSNNSSMTYAEVPYTAKELSSLPNKGQLYERIARQIERWPKDVPLVFSRTKRSVMEECLLDPKNGFTKTVQGVRVSSSVENPSETEMSPQEGPIDGSELLLEGEQNHDKGVESTGEPRQPNPHLSVPVYIEDRRFNTIKKLVLHMAITPSYDVQEMVETTATHIQTYDLVHQLSVSPVLDPKLKHVKISHPYPENPDYKEYLYIGTIDKQEIDNSDILQSTVRLPKSSPFVIYVEQVGSDVEINTVAVAGTVGVPLVSSAKPLEIAQSRSSSASHGGSSTRHGLHHIQKRDMVAWLKKQAQNFEGYNSFKSSAHRVVQNPEAVSSWAFASEFYNEYFDQRYLDEDSSGSDTNTRVKGQRKAGTKVTKTAIQEALDVGATWLSEALTATRLVRAYGLGGKREDPTVVAALSSRVDHPDGRTALYRFLSTVDETYQKKTGE